MGLDDKVRRNITNDAPVNALIEIRTSNCTPRFAVTTNTSPTLTATFEINKQHDSKRKHSRYGCNTYYREDADADCHRHRSSEPSYNITVPV